MKTAYLKTNTNEDNLPGINDQWREFTWNQRPKKTSYLQSTNGEVTLPEIKDGPRSIVAHVPSFNSDKASSFLQRTTSSTFVSTDDGCQVRILPFCKQRPSVEVSSSLWTEHEVRVLPTYRRRPLCKRSTFLEATTVWSGFFLSADNFRHVRVVSF